MRLGKRIVSIVMSAVCACTLVPVMALAAPVWNDSNWLDHSYTASAMKWQSNSYIQLKGGAYSYTGDDGRARYVVSTGSAVRFCNVGYDTSNAGVDLEVYGVNSPNIALLPLGANDNVLTPGSACEFWIETAHENTSANGHLRISLYKAGTSTLADAKLAFGIYDIDQFSQSTNPETFSLYSSNASLYSFPNSRLVWNGNSCSSPKNGMTGGYDRASACYVVSNGVSVDTGFSGYSCGMCYSFFGTSVMPDSPRKVSTDTK